MACKKHPKYLAKRPPRADCVACQLQYAYELVRRQDKQIAELYERVRDLETPYWER